MKKVRYPLSVRANNTLEFLEETESLFEQDLRIFFYTNELSRVMRPTLGDRILKYLEEPFNDNTKNAFLDEIVSAMTRNFPQIILKNIDFQNKKLTIDYNFRNQINTPNKQVTFNFTT
jgi:phage baseplate assembly protein W